MYIKDKLYEKIFFTIVVLIYFMSCSIDNQPEKVIKAKWYLYVMLFSSLENFKGNNVCSEIVFYNTQEPLNSIGNIFIEKRKILMIDFEPDSISVKENRTNIFFSANYNGKKMGTLCIQFEKRVDFIGNDIAYTYDKGITADHRSNTDKTNQGFFLLEKKMIECIKKNKYHANSWLLEEARKRKLL